VKDISSHTHFLAAMTRPQAGRGGIKAGSTNESNERLMGFMVERLCPEPIRASGNAGASSFQAAILDEFPPERYKPNGNKTVKQD
jgi:hypothetical protein